MPDGCATAPIASGGTLSAQAPLRAQENNSPLRGSKGRGCAGMSPTSTPCSPCAVSFSNSPGRPTGSRALSLPPECQEIDMHPMKVLFEKKGPLAYVTINRPERLNACDGETYRRLTEVWREFRDDPALRVGILTGAGDRAFCVGTDVKADDFARLGAELHNLPFALLAELGKPLIAAINGHANGSGLEQALCCDIRVAAEHAQLGLGDARLGWLPAAGGTQRLSRLSPAGRALPRLDSGNPIGAPEAVRRAMVSPIPPQR